MNKNTLVRARFAPSPTGTLHIGGARTALFNWLFCKHHGGRFVVRIEDTDILRNIEGAEEKLLDDLRWLGLDWDEGPEVPGDYGPYRQSQRRHFYQEATEKLLAAGDAYYAFDTPEELDAMRKAARAEKRSFRYPRPKTFATKDEADWARSEGRPVVVRFKARQDPVTIHDEILGDVDFPAGEVDDFILVKKNGWPTYHFAVVVDDYLMKITHVLRAQEHLMNTPKHVQLQRVLGYRSPKYAHLPLVFNMDGTKMSKRDKHKVVRKAVKQWLIKPHKTKGEAARIAECSETALEHWLNKADRELDMEQVSRLADATGVDMPEIDVDDFRVSGYLPEALVNFIALIGWSPGDDREKMSLDEMIGAFSLNRINKTSGRFDRVKLLAMNTDYAAAESPQKLLAAFKDWAGLSQSVFANVSDDTVVRVLAACRGFRSFTDVEDKAGILFLSDDQVRYDPKAVKKVLEKKGGRGYEMLDRLLPELRSVETWSADTLETMIKDFCERHNAKLGDVAQPLRVAVTGHAISPAIGETLSFLGREKTINRIQICLRQRAAGPSQTV